MSALEELTQLASTLQNQAVKDWKAEGKKAIGFFCLYVPEEILHAAGILPYRIRATGCTETTLADVYMSHLNCSFARSCLQFAFEGKYDFLDGLVYSNSCDDTRRMYDNLRTVEPDRFGYMHFIDIPKKSDPEDVDWFAAQLEEFKQSVEQAFGVEVTDEKLRHAVEVHNETRRLLREVYQLREQDKPPITGAETLEVVLAAMTSPRERINELLRQLLEELKDREGISDYRARLMIAGSGGCDDPAYLKIMEELGGLIVADAICFGSKYFWEPVRIEGNDVMRSIAKSYLNRPSCARMMDKVEERIRFIKDMVQDYAVDGVVYQTIRQCQLWGGQLLSMRTELGKAQIPLLPIDREYALSGTGQLKTRIQAFLERIER